MNWYFWGFALYAFLITPVRLHVDLQIASGVRWRLCLQAAGLTLARSRTQQQPASAHPSRPDPAVWIGVWRQGAIGPLLRSLRLKALDIRILFSFADAAGTALAFALARTAAQTIACCVSPGPALRCRLTADFHAGGTQLALRSIFVSRLGTLGIAAARLGLAVLRARARLVLAEEETYAAASH